MIKSKELLVASPYTRLFWIEHKLDPLRNDYNIVFDQTILGNLDVQKLRSALKQFVLDYPLMNSHLIEQDGELYWEDNDSIAPLTFYDLDLEENVVKTPFDLEKGPLYRFALCKKNKDRYNFIIILHHALIDGSSFDEFIRIISAYYNTHLKDNQSVSDLNACYRQLESKVRLLHKSNSSAFWKNALFDLPERNDISYLGNRFSEEKQIKEIRFSVSKKCWKELEANFNTPLSHFNVFILIWGVLIARYSNQTSAHIGYPISINEGLKFTYGAHINTLVLPIRLNTRKFFINLYDELLSFIEHLKVSNKLKHSYLPIFEIISSSQLKQVNVGFAQTNLKNTPFSFKACQVEVNHRYNIDIAGYELLLEYEERDNAFNFRLRYHSNLFSDQQIEQLPGHYTQLLENILGTPNVPVLEHPILTKNEYNQIVYQWNQTDKPYPKDKTIHQLFEKQVKKTPDNIALVFEDKNLTYQQLNERSNQLARYIRKQYQEVTKENLKPDTLIALCLERSLEMIVAILAVLKAGGAYVPIDPDYPEARVQYILEDTNTKLLLTQSHLISRLTATINRDSAATLIEVDSADYQQEKLINLKRYSKSTDLAYVIYTSGTTGQPKGVMVEHASVMNIVSVTCNTYQVTVSSKCTQYANYAFDASVCEIFPTLLVGAELSVLSKAKQTNLEAFYEYLIYKKMTHLVLPTIVFQQLNADFKETDIEFIYIGGDTLSNQIIKPKNARLFNQYGPTEGTVCATQVEICQLNNITIGSPIQNVKVYVLDAHLNPAPTGVIGELHIGGAGLARGYLNKPKLTQERFINNPSAIG